MKKVIGQALAAVVMLGLLAGCFPKNQLSQTEWNKISTRFYSEIKPKQAFRAAETILLLDNMEYTPIPECGQSVK